ncbi:hypothetical protein V1525DRAFT_383383 [Lipomyces kononenkoae]|uniref:Uncharacterized protein n=1 Tax=Lipomyces kononenkoae TaxID=34357 RepID=A0ACC3STL0_LIPKO
MTAQHSKYSSHLHHPSPPAADQPEYNMRKRVGKACDSCRIKKAKCDGRKPCSRCIMDDRICTFSERKKSKERVYSSSYVDILESRIELLQNCMAEFIRRVNRGDDISCLLSKSGQVPINRALEELASQVIELQKEECERSAIVHDHDESEQEMEHEHNHDSDSVTANDPEIEDGSIESEFYRQIHALPDLNVDTTTIAQTSFSASQHWAVAPFLPVGTNIGAHDPETPGMTTDLIDPATVIRDHNQLGPMSPSSMTSASSLYSSSSTSPSPIDMQFVTLDYAADTVRPQSGIYDALNDVISNSMKAEPILSDMWLTNTFMEI